MEGETKASRRSRRSTKKSVSQPAATTAVAQPGTQPVAEHGVQSDTQVSCKPSAQPILSPAQPGAQPVAQTVTQLSAPADTQPNAQPSVQPNAQPDAQAEAKPDAQPDAQPSVQPDVQPDGQPVSQPGVQPDVQPDGQPDAEPSAQPTTLPTSPMSPECPLEPGAATATCTTVLTSPLDHILIFGHGRFQRVVLLCTTLAFFSTITHGLANAGLARPVGHWCRLPPEYSDMPKTTWKNTSIPFEADGKTRSECLRYEPPYTLSYANGVDNRTAIPCDAGWEYDKLVDTDFGSYSVVNEWDLVCERRWIMTLLTASYMSGGILGAATAGIAADNIGRRPVLRISLFVLVLSGVSLAFSGSIMMFATLRAFISAASASVLVTSVVTLFEVTDTPHRALFCSLAEAGAAITSAVYVELIYNLAPTWQIAQMGYIAPTSIMIISVYFMEESPCWLLAVSNMRRAESVLSWAARVNKVEPDVFKKRLSELKAEIKRQQEQPESGAHDILLQEHGVHVADMLMSGTLRQRSAILFCCSFISFAMVYNLNTGEVMRTNLLARAVLVVLRLPVIMMGVPFITYAGRRKSLAFSMFAMSLLALAISGAHAFGAREGLLAAVTVSWLLVFDVYAITMFIISSELYPTVVRGAGFGLCYTFGRMGAVVAPFVNEIKSGELKGVAYAIAALLLLISGAMAWMLPETTKLLPANTIRELSADNKWALRSPLRIARIGRRKRPKGENRDRSKVRSKLSNAPGKDVQ